jgi:ABC-2 type transport system ATP-binding protein
MLIRGEDVEIIKTTNLNLDYKVYKRKPGPIEAVKGIFYKKHESVSALQNINLSIQEGEIIGFVGPNGAGKTSLLKILSGLIHPTSGTVKINGFNPVERKKEFLKLISIIMGQRSQLMWDISPLETFIVNQSIYNIDKRVFNERLNELTELLKVGNSLDKPVRQLSLGERMKMEIISSLLHSPKVLFLDEPTIGLDFESQAAIRKFIKDYNKEYKITTIITSHYMEDIKSLCERLILINSGQIIYDGDLKELVNLNSQFKYMSFKTDTLTFEKIKDYIEKNESSGYEYNIKVSTNQIKDVMHILLDSDNLMDLTIQNQPIEEIIMKVIQGRGGGTQWRNI